MSKSNAKADDPITAFVVAEPLAHQNVFKTAGVSLALAPIANRPCIDYCIENLIHNGVRKIVVLTNTAEEPAIRSHVQRAWSHVSNPLAARNKGNSASHHGHSSHHKSHHHQHHHHDANNVVNNNTRSASGEIDSIEVRSCPLGNGFYDVMAFLKLNNYIRDGGYFMVVPLDGITNICNIQQLIARAVERHVKEKLILTAVVRQDDQSLRSIYEAVMQSEIDRISSEDKASFGVSYLATPYPGGDRTFNMSFVDEETYMDETSFAPRCTFVFNPVNGMVHAFKEWKKLDDDVLDRLADGGDRLEAPYPPLPSVPIKKHAERVCVRTDLMLTGILICSSDVINCAFDKYQLSVSDVVDTFLANQIEWNMDIGIDVADSASVVCPINSLAAFLTANQRVNARYLYPMTRESNFGDVPTSYYVSRRAPLVCVPKEGCPAVRGTIEGSAVFGLRTVLDESSFVSNASVGDDTKVGKNVTISNAVIGRNVTIHDGAVIVGALILDNSVVTANFEVRESIYGAAATPANAKRALMSITGQDGKSVEMPRGNIISTFEMLTSDNVTGHVEEAADDPNEWKNVLWNSYLNNKGIDVSLFALRELRTTYTKTDSQLVEAMFEMLVVYLEGIAIELRKKAKEEEGEDFDEDAPPAWDQLRPYLVDKLTTWEKKILWEEKFLHLGDDDDAFKILRGVALGIHRSPSIQPLAGKILALLYCLLDETIFEKRDFCIVPSSAIIAFLKEREEYESDSDDGEDGAYEEDDSSDDDDYDLDEEELQRRAEAGIRSGWSFLVPYAEKVRASCEEDSDDEDEDSNEDDEDEDDADEEESEEDE